jgi:hypothetical protein
MKLRLKITNFKTTIKKVCKIPPRYERALQRELEERLNEEPEVSDLVTEYFLHLVEDYCEGLEKGEKWLK